MIFILPCALPSAPAWVCAQCGEVYFDEAEVDTIQQIIRAVDEKTEKMSVSV
ncbi:YgiT-type zinc finger protein [Candidatus Kuenenia sp.]|uniref:YgiT-type zinc finger protein n=1 Tax=Candidatus Kuenenia sp. TaxID=2499824 RepID=UPI00321FEFC6